MKKKSSSPRRSVTTPENVEMVREASILAQDGRLDKMQAS